MTTGDGASLHAVQGPRRGRSRRPPPLAGRQSPRQLNFVRWSQIFESPQFGRYARDLLAHGILRWPLDFWQTCWSTVCCLSLGTGCESAVSFTSRPIHPPGRSSRYPLNEAKSAQSPTRTSYGQSILLQSGSEARYSITLLRDQSLYRLSYRV